ncbi:MAG: hypothetical protein K0R17_2876 [Rariglobus sp.]|jgi:hypothetical protein|nr:hypothetical protein [Rariglobus sp.]
MSEPEPSPSAVSAVAEVQGLYGAFSFPERLLQKIWQRGDFDGTATRTADGRALKVLHPGRWNHLGGPDFAGARLVIDGHEITGEVELHLHAKDWAAHGHASDPAYDNVILHVVLFPCVESATRGAGGRAIPILCLLPVLHHGLEEYAADEAMEQLAGRPLHHAQEILGALGNDELDTLLRGHAGRRWLGKVHFARERIKRLGWEGACHHAALEILGYRFNRAPMLSAATAFPLADWAGGRADPAQVFDTFAERWSLQGVRPLNHPRLRLRQYAAWCKARPDWPERLRNYVQLHELAASDRTMTTVPAGDWRRVVRLKERRARLQDDLCAGVLSGSRLDNLAGDGFLPLLAAETGLNLEVAWSGWFAGDAPEAVVRVLRALGVFGGRDRPVSQGPVQGLLGWMLAYESHLQAQRAPLHGRGT